MAYDQTGATVGAAGHDAATILAALIASGGVGVGVGDVQAAYKDLTTDIVNTLLELQATVALEQGGTKPTRVATAPSSSSSGGGDYGDVEFKGGKYAGKSIADVYSEAPDYLEWIAGNDAYKNDFMRSRIKTFLANAA